MKEKKTGKKKITINRKAIIMMVIALFVCIVVIVGINRWMAYLEEKEYAPYEAKMNQYGFHLLYNNKSAKGSERVTKSEAIKQIVGATFNTYDISNISNDPTDTYQNARWVEYARDKEMIEESAVDANNENKKASKGEVILWFAGAKQALLNASLDKADGISYTNYQKLDSELQAAIADAITNGILTNEKKKFSKEATIKKGELNKWIVEYVEKYQTITVNHEQLETDTTLYPSNANQFPYIAKGIEKNVYELPFKNATQKDFSNPIATYVNKKEYYKQIAVKTEAYFNAILNINYQTITVESFMKSLEDWVAYPLKETDVTAYVNYVKEHQIILEGKATVQMPIIYEWDDTYYVRTKLDFEIKSGKTNQNVLFKDATIGTVTYEDKKYTTYVDTNLYLLLKSHSLSIYEKPVYSILCNKENVAMKGGV